jgi:hypothetical protein
MCPSCFVAYYRGYRDGMAYCMKQQKSLCKAMSKRTVYNGRLLTVDEKMKQWVEKQKKEAEQ